jgi:hypothetical protein
MLPTESVSISSKTETLSYFGMLFYDNQQKPEGISNKVGLYLPKQVFTHGQQYVAFSRVTRRDGLRVMINDEESKDGEVVKNINIRYGK